MQLGAIGLEVTDLLVRVLATRSPACAASSSICRQARSASSKVPWGVDALAGVVTEPAWGIKPN